jgi:hypothetical protein
MLRVKGPVHRSSGLVTERNLNVRKSRSKSRPPHALFECSLYNQVSFDWTTSFLSDETIINLREKAVNKRFYAGTFHGSASRFLVPQQPPSAINPVTKQECRTGGYNDAGDVADHAAFTNILAIGPGVSNHPLVPFRIGLPG